MRSIVNLPTAATMRTSPRAAARSSGGERKWPPPQSSCPSLTPTRRPQSPDSNWRPCPTTCPRRDPGRDGGITAEDRRRCRIIRRLCAERRRLSRKKRRKYLTYKSNFDLLYLICRFYFKLKKTVEDENYIAMSLNGGCTKKRQGKYDDHNRAAPH